MPDLPASNHPFALSTSQAELLTAAMMETFFRGWDGEHLASESGRRDVEELVFRRYDECLTKIVPWIQRHVALKDQRVVEIGCGAGTSTSALARYAGHVDAYDIDAGSVDGARARARILGQENITFHVEPAATLLSQVMQDHPEGTADVVVLYAVLEHQHPMERLGTLSACWGMLRTGGLLVVVEMPNRLAYFDPHTSLLPFFSMLPPDIAVRYAARSPRPMFVQSIGEARAASEGGALEVLARWGCGVSFHEFELALGGALEDLLVGDGFDPEILDIRAVTMVERCLYTYWVYAGVAAPAAFVRQDLDLIFRKGGGADRRGRELPISALLERVPEVQVSPPLALRSRILGGLRRRVMG